MGLQKRYSKKEAEALLAAATHKIGDRVAILDGWCVGSVGQVIDITLSQVYRGRLRYEVKIDGAPLGFHFYPDEIGPPPPRKKTKNKELNIDWDAINTAIWVDQVFGED